MHLQGNPPHVGSLLYNPLLVVRSPLGVISALPRVHIILILISKLYSRGFLCTTSVLISALLPSSVQIEITLTPQYIWDMPLIVLIYTCCLLQAYYRFAVTIEWEHPVSIRTEHYTPSTCTLIMGKATFTDWRGKGGDIVLLLNSFSQRELHHMAQFITSETTYVTLLEPGILFWPSNWVHCIYSTSSRRLRFCSLFHMSV